MEREVWLSPRALRLHAVILVVVPAFMAMCVWQITRALGGNELSWAYVFEWPLFAAYAVYMWWRLLHESSPATSPPVAAGTASGEQAIDAPETTPIDDPGLEPGEDEDPELAAYNAYLAELAEQDRAAGR